MFYKIANGGFNLGSSAGVKSNRSATTTALHHTTTTALHHTTTTGQFLIKCYFPDHEFSY